MDRRRCLGNGEVLRGACERISAHCLTFSKRLAVLVVDLGDSAPRSKPPTSYSDDDASSSILRKTSGRGRCLKGGDVRKWMFRRFRDGEDDIEDDKGVGEF